MKNSKIKTRRPINNYIVQQRLMGLMLILISIVAIMITSTGTTPRDQDGTAILLILPLGIWLLFSKERVIV